ncbi:MAG: MBL fold metallo-hydrolase [Candidatus Bathyarchaeia archaeon]
MNRERFFFKIGNFECIVVKDGEHAYPYPAKNVFINFFVNAPKEELEQMLREHGLNSDGWEEYVSPYVSLVINTGDGLILVDTGAGAMAATTGKLMQNLQSEGLAPEDFDKVILTHAHPDHIGGNLDSQGKPAFPNARYIISKTEWDFWMLKAEEELKLPEEAKNSSSMWPDTIFYQSKTSWT